MKFITIAALVITLSVAASAQQHQQQHQVSNSFNHNENSHNTTAEGGGGGAGGSAAGGAASLSSDYERQTATAIGTGTFHTAPCIKSWGAGGQSGYAGVSLGGGKVDKGCDIRETAEEFRNAGSQTAFCKVMVTEPSAVKAGVTFEDCMATQRGLESRSEAIGPQAIADAAPEVVLLQNAPIALVDNIVMPVKAPATRKVVHHACPVGGGK